MADSLDSSERTPAVQQDVKGDRNQTIGQVLGGVVINQLTIHERIPEPSLPPPVSATKPLTQQEYRQRKVLLTKVKEYWVKGVLETSLHAKALIELGLQERPEMVQRPFSGVEEFSPTPGQALPAGTAATTVFDQMGQGRTLLILGEPGSGKTITLLKLAQDLLARTEVDFSQPIPVVFNLSSWAKKPQTIEQWLVQELLEKYQVSKALGKTWVETEALILLLDGLDEVKAEQRNACVQALNQFMQTHGTTELVICCRIQDYQALADRLMLRSAICIQPLTSDQIDHYFEQAGEQLASLKEVLRQDEELQGLATSPLMLSIMSLAYQGSNLKEIIQGGRPEDYRQRLFDTYIDRMFQRRGTTQQYSRQKTQHWLIWLAQRMTAAAQTVFLIERLQPNWLLGKEQRIIYPIVSGLSTGIIVLAAWLIVGLVSLNNVESITDKFSLFFDTTDSPLTNKQGFATLRFTLGKPFLGLVTGLVTALCVACLGEIRTIETLKWSWQAARKTLWSCLIMGPAIGLLVGLSLGILLLTLGESYRLDAQSIMFLLGLTSLLGLVLGTIIGLAIGLISGIRGPTLEQTTFPNQGVWSSVNNACKIGSIAILPGFLISFLGHSTNIWLAGVMLGFMSSLIGGGTTCIRHLVLRIMLYYCGYSPWNFTCFLNYAADHLFLQKVGGGYIFVHRMLLEHFAAMPLEQEKR